jgi:NADH dehydrogenase
MTFVVIGAGPTGVEMAGTMIEIAHHTLPEEFRRIDSRSARVVLMEGSDRVLGAFVPALSERARQQLVKLGVEVRTGCQVTDIDADGVTHQTKGAAGSAPVTHRLPCRTVVWAAGVAASPLGRALAQTTGVSLDRAGRVEVQPDLSIASFPTITVIGDLAAARSHPKGLTNHAALSSIEPTTPVPGVSPAAKQMGRLTAANLMRRVRNEPSHAFHYADYGNLATVGRHAAVVDLTVPVFGALRFSGTLAWWFWLLAHVYFLIGFRNRLIVMLDWGVAYWTYERSARVVAQPAPARTVTHTAAGALPPLASTPGAPLASGGASGNSATHS